MDDLYTKWVSSEEAMKKAATGGELIRKTVNDKSTAAQTENMKKARESGKAQLEEERTRNTQSFSA